MAAGRSQKVPSGLDQRSNPPRLGNAPAATSGMAAAETIVGRRLAIVPKLNDQGRSQPRVLSGETVRVARVEPALLSAPDFESKLFWTERASNASRTALSHPKPFRPHLYCTCSVKGFVRIPIAQACQIGDLGTYPAPAPGMVTADNRGARPDWVGGAPVTNRTCGLRLRSASVQRITRLRRTDLWRRCGSGDELH